MNQNKEILEGFNAGYLLEKHDPALAKQLNEAVSEVGEDFFQAFIEGRKEFIKDKSRSKLFKQLEKDFSNLSKSPSKQKGKGRPNKDY
ncbi:MAG: hypothetical protein Sapg2KO_24510 [Saprospiraceae bacterium]